MLVEVLILLAIKNPHEIGFVSEPTEVHLGKIVMTTS
jgi:hypothetical protein